MADSTDEFEELEPLFDYSRVHPFDPACFDDDDGSSPPFPSKKQKVSGAEKEPEEEEVKQIVDCVNIDEEEDWLSPSQKISNEPRNLNEDSTLKELRLKKQELISLTQSAEDVVRNIEASFKWDLSALVKSSSDTVAVPPSKPPIERAKIIISIQDKDELQHFRVYMDDKFRRIFKMYADKAKLDVQNLVFSFDGDKISHTATPEGLGMEDNDIIEVHVKSS